MSRYVTLSKTDILNIVKMAYEAGKNEEWVLGFDITLPKEDSVKLNSEIEITTVPLLQATEQPPIFLNVD